MLRHIFLYREDVKRQIPSIARKGLQVPVAPGFVAVDRSGTAFAHPVPDIGHEVRGHVLRQQPVGDPARLAQREGLEEGHRMEQGGLDGIRDRERGSYVPAGIHPVELVGEQLDL